MCESFMIASIRSLFVPPPNASRQSASPSSCKHPVKSSLAMIAKRMEIPIGKKNLVIKKTNAIVLPVSRDNMFETGCRNLTDTPEWNAGKKNEGSKNVHLKNVIRSIWLLLLF